MHFNNSYAGVLHNASELLVWSEGYINIGEIEKLDLYEFEAYREIFKRKYESDEEDKKEFVKHTFEFARSGIETICKTISNAFGGKRGKSNKLG